MIVFGGLGRVTSPLSQTLSDLADVTGAQGVFVFDAPDLPQAQSATEGLLEFLSHDHPLDTAANNVAASNGLSLLAWATRRLVQESSLREQGLQLARQLQQLPRSRLRLDPATATELGGSSERNLPRRRAWWRSVQA